MTNIKLSLLLTLVIYDGPIARPVFYVISGNNVYIGLLFLCSYYFVPIVH